MKTVFADTHYFIALVSPGDVAHARAMAFTQGYSARYLTTQDVLTEFANGLSDVNSRLEAIALIAAIRANKAMRVV